MIRPRLSDAAFFFSNDKNTPLASRQERLGSVVFQHKLGTLLDKPTVSPRSHLGWPHKWTLTSADSASGRALQV